MDHEMPTTYSYRPPVGTIVDRLTYRDHRLGATMPKRPKPKHAIVLAEIERADRDLRAAAHRSPGAAAQACVAADAVLNRTSGLLGDVNGARDRPSDELLDAYLSLYRSVEDLAAAAMASAGYSRSSCLDRTRPAPSNS